MNKNNNEKFIINEEDKFFLKFFFFNFLILILFLLLNIIEINFLIERAKIVFGFWITLFLIVFLPRRLLKKSKKFRYFVLYLRKNYPIIFYYQFNWFYIGDWIYFIFLYTRHYFERILKYFLVGTQVKYLQPYKKNWEKGEFIKDVIIEIYQQTWYMILYILKIFYEIINFFDNASIYKIIKIRILGYMLVTIMYIIIGNKFFIIYVLSIIIGFYIYANINMYVNYKRLKKQNYDLNILNEMLANFGYYNKIVFFYHIEIEKLRHQVKFLFFFIKVKHGFYYKSIKRKNGEKKAMNCMLGITALTKVTKDFKFLDEIKNSHEINKDQIIFLSRNKYIMKFHLMRLWYIKPNSILENDIDDSFVNCIHSLQNMVNLLHFKMLFLMHVKKLLTNDEEPDEKINEENFNKFFNKETKKGIFYFFYLKRFFEFSEINNFIKEVEKKRNKLGYKGLKNKLMEIDKIFTICNKLLWQKDLLVTSELFYIYDELIIEFWNILEIEYNKNDYDDYIAINKDNSDNVFFKYKNEFLIQKFINELRKIKIEELEKFLNEMNYFFIHECLFDMNEKKIIEEDIIRIIFFVFKLKLFNYLNLKLYVDEEIINYFIKEKISIQLNLEKINDYMKKEYSKQNQDLIVLNWDILYNQLVVNFKK